MKKLIFSLFVVLAFTACNEATVKSEKQEKPLTKTEIIVRGEAQGTTYTVKYIAEEYNGIKEEFDALLKAIDLSMSTYVPNSLITKLNNGDSITMDAPFKKMYQLSQELSEATGSAFNPTIGPLIKAWGFDYSDPEKMDTATVQALLSSCGFDNFEVEGDLIWKKNEKARINFNAIAQGYSVDLMADLLDQKGVLNYYVELGGELKVKGKNKRDEAWIIGIDSPDGENLERKLVDRIQLKDAAMATSGNYRKFYEVEGERFSHTLDPLTGFPAKNKILSATVIAKDAGVADAMATAFMVMGMEKAKQYLKAHKELEAYFIYVGEGNSFNSYITEGLKEQIVKD